MNDQNPKPVDKLVSIELLRFVSAFAVLVWHYQHFGFTARGIVVNRNAQPFYDLLTPFYNFGLIGLQVFWCVSGFIFFYKYYGAISGYTVGFSKFAMNRFSRLYPLHFVTLLYVLALQIVFSSLNGYYFVYPFNDAKHFVLNLLFVSHWGLQEGMSFNAPIWSVSLEIIVYILFYFLARFFSLFATYAMAVCIVGLAIKFNVWPLAQCVALFFCGGFIAVAKYYPESVPWMRVGKRGAFVLVGVALSASLLLLLALKTSFPDLQIPLYKSLMMMGITINAICLGLYVTIALNRFMQVFARSLVFLGNMTYSSYLLHFPIQLTIVVLSGYFGVAVQLYDTSVFLGYIGVTLVLSALVYRYFEAPAQSYIRRKFPRVH